MGLRISLTFLCLTCLVGMMMLVTISRYGSESMGEISPMGIRSVSHYEPSIKKSINKKLINKKSKSRNASEYFIQSPSSSPAPIQSQEKGKLVQGYRRRIFPTKTFLLPLKPSRAKILPMNAASHIDNIMISTSNVYSSTPMMMTSYIVDRHVSSPSPSPFPSTKPKITFDWEDLETTNKFVINKSNFCDEDNGATTDLLVIIFSAVTHFNARDAIRKTWGGFAIERGAKLVFLLGSPSPLQDYDGSIQDQVNQEDNQYSDILQGSFIDNYYNLTLKSISMLQWVNETCDAVKYVLKIDDDMFVNMQMMVDFSETRTFSKVIIGKLARKWRPHHDSKSKWYVPTSAFNGTIFPNFATGPAYIFTGDATKFLLETALVSTPIYLEDVYVTGIVAEKAGVRRLNHALMKNVRLRVDACTFKRFITSHQHSPQEIIHLWKVVYEPPTRNCTVVKSSVTQSAAQLAAAQLLKQRQAPLPPADVRSMQQQHQVQSAPSLTIQLPQSNMIKVVPPTPFQSQQSYSNLNNNIMILNPVPPVKVIPNS